MVPKRINWCFKGWIRHEVGSAGYKKNLPAWFKAGRFVDTLSCGLSGTNVTELFIYSFFWQRIFDEFSIRRYGLRGEPGNEKQNFHTKPAIDCSFADILVSLFCGWTRGGDFIL